MQSIKKLAKIEYALMAYNLVLVLYLFAALPFTIITTGKYALLVFLGSVFVAGLAGYACVRAKVRLSRIHLLAIGFYLWLLVSVGYHFAETGVDNVPHLLLFFCFVFPSFLSFLSFTKAQYITQWQVMAVGYNLVVSVLCAAGVWCTLADLCIKFLVTGYKYIAFIDLKLYIFTHYNGVAHFVGFAMILAIFMVCCAGKTWVRVLFAIDFVLLYVTLGLTYSRTVELTLAACMGIAVCYYIWHAPRWRAVASAAKNICLRLVVCGVAFVGIVAVGYIGMVQANAQSQAYISAVRAQNNSDQVTYFIAAQPQEPTTAPVVSAISATTTTASNRAAVVGAVQQTSVQNSSSALVQIASIDTQDMTQEEYIAYLQETRSLSDLSTLGARFYYWETTLRYFITDLECQLWGTSPAGVVLLLAEILPEANAPHAHNVFVQVLVALGWVGFALFVALWGVCLFCAVKSFFTKQHGFAGDCLPLLLLLGFTAMGLQENMMFSTEASLMLPAFFMACASVACLAQNKET